MSLSWKRGSNTGWVRLGGGGDMGEGNISFVLEGGGKGVDGGGNAKG